MKLQKRLVVTLITITLFSTLFSQTEKKPYIYFPFTKTLNQTSGFVSAEGTLTFNAELRGGALIKNGILYLDGKDDHLYLGINPDFHLNKYTIAAMIYIKGFGTDPQRIEVLEKTNEYWLNIRTDTGLLRGGSFLGATEEIKNTSWFYKDSNEKVPQNEWVHVASVYDGKSLVLYINGKKSSELLDLPNTIQKNDYPMAIGAKVNLDNKTVVANFMGMMDEIAVYNTVLKESEIYALYKKTLK